VNVGSEEPTQRTLAKYLTTKWGKTRERNRVEISGTAQSISRRINMKMGE
jgi:hypothetical protein